MICPNDNDKNIGKRQATRIILVSIIVCTLFGTFLGSVFWGILAGHPFVFFYVDIAGVPVCIYAFLTVGPFGIVAGFIAGIIILALIYLKLVKGELTQWVLIGIVSGMIVGVTLPLFLLLTMGGNFEKGMIIFSIIAALAGGICGVTLGYYGWLESHKIDLNIAKK